MSRSWVKVYFLDDSATAVSCDTETTADDVVALVADKIELVGNVSEYKLLEVKPDFVHILADEDKPLQFKNEWTANKGGVTNRFVLKRMYFMDPNETFDDPVEKHLMFIQSRHSVATSRCYVEPELAMRLAALYMQVEYGPHKPDIHVPGFLAPHISQYIPAGLMRTKSVNEWESGVLQHHASLTNFTRDQAVDAYIAELERLPHARIATFPAKYVQCGTNRMGTKVYIGVSSKGVHILDHPNMAVNGFYCYNSILSWGASVNSFSMSTDESPEGLRHTFETKE
ncbi:hypothetical protein KIPB_010725, partial [Kipferlia bialata]|eukprot:g10725.t1